MGHGHLHSHNEIKSRNLLISTLLNLIITVVEIIGGLVSHSLALLSDALHNLGDTSAVFIAYVAHLISKKDYTDKRTFGYKRIEILAALFNAVLLIVIIVYLFIEAVKRIKNPETIRGNIMFIVACVGFVANLIAVFLLKNDSHKNLNIRAAYLHLLGDTVSSVTVILGAVFIYLFNFYWLDSAITIAVGIYLLIQTYSILRKSIDILMQAKPRDLDLDEVKRELEHLAEVDNIHHVHAWNLNDSEIHFECHVDLVDDIRVSQTEEIKDKIHAILLNKFNITHVTVQYEFNCCDNKEMIHTR